jgi:fructokinase
MHPLESEGLDVLCFGEALVDLLPDRRGRLEDCERFEVCAGGAPANVATGLARLGARVAFRGVVGDDPFGRLLARKLESEGVRCALRFARERPTGMWFVALDAAGERTFFSPNARVSADKLLTPADVDRALLSRARWLHCGSSAHLLAAGQDALREAVGAARDLGVRVSFDPNVRLHLWDDPRLLRRLCADVLPSCDLAKMSGDEAEICTGIGDPDAAAASLVEMGVGLACVTLGAEGALVRRGADVLRVPAERVEIVDTTGAGDAFVAGLLSVLSRAGPIEALSLAALERAARFATRVAARAVTRVGAVAGLPRAGEISI